MRISYIINGEKHEWSRTEDGKVAFHCADGREITFTAMEVVEFLYWFAGMSGEEALRIGRASDPPRRSPHSNPESA